LYNIMYFYMIHAIAKHKSYFIWYFHHVHSFHILICIIIFHIIFSIFHILSIYHCWVNQFRILSLFWHTNSKMAKLDIHFLYPQKLHVTFGLHMSGFEILTSVC
jgi:hypothetical protein